MATWNVQTKTTDKNGKQKHLGQVTTQIQDWGRAKELAERQYGEDVTVVRESHLVRENGKLTKKDD